MEVKRMFSERGQELLLINNFKFCISRKNKNVVHWRCANKNAKCSATVRTSHNDYSVLITSDVNHNHSEELNIQRQMLSNTLKIRAVSNLTEKPAKLIEEEIRTNFDDEFTSYDINLLRKNIWKCRRNVLRPAQEQVSNEPFLLIKNKTKKISIRGYLNPITA